MTNPNEIGDILVADQAIASRVLKMANSSYYGMQGKGFSIRKASVRGVGFHGHEHRMTGYPRCLLPHGSAPVSTLTITIVFCCFLWYKSGLCDDAAEASSSYASWGLYEDKM
ncbi:MAG: HDOD domain-containing protein [Thermodesulfobacteriota bacterium]|nr:HDOD domain-containing protein [Thermodesulfobacteriota bacterium]